MKDKSQTEKLTWEEVFEQLSLIPGDFTCDFLNAGRTDFPIEEKEESKKYKYNDTYIYISLQ